MLPFIAEKSERALQIAAGLLLLLPPFAASPAHPAGLSFGPLFNIPIPLFNIPIFVIAVQMCLRGDSKNVIARALNRTSATLR